MLTDESMNMCRSCLSSESDMISLNTSLIDSFMLLTDLSVNLNDELPQKICQKCAITIETYIQFREQSITSDKTLRNIIQNIKKEENLSILSDSEEYVYQELEIKIKDCKADLGQSLDPCKEEEIKTEYLCDNDIFEEYETYIQEENPVEDEEEDLYRKSSRCKKSPRRLGTEEGRTKNKKTRSNFKQQEIVTSVGKTQQFHCGICPEIFDDESILNKHLETHKTNKVCEICKDSMSTWPELFGHRLKHLPPNQYKCHMCKKRQKVPLYLEYHYLTVHYEGQEKRLRCKICNRTYSSPKQVLNHMRTKHSGFKYYCDHCTKGFYCKYVLKKHMGIHDKTQNFICKLCDYTSKTMQSLKHHQISKHTKSKVKCRKCTRIFENQEKYDKHKCSDAKTKCIVCPICGVLVKKATMYIHKDSHKAEGKYKCNRCPKTFRTRSNLVAHIDRHDGNRRWRCEHCSLSFYTQTTLIKHRRVHTGEKPYVCKICTKAFTGNHNLKVHMRVHGQFLIVKKTKDEDATKVS